MSALFNSSLIPFARETGAAVVLIHHHDKKGTGARGAGAIENAADGSYNLHSDGPEHMRWSPGKCRRKRAFDELFIAVNDTPEGGLELQLTDPRSPVF